MHVIAEEEEYYPKLSAKELARHFEKTIEEAAPNKKIKVITHYYNYFPQSTVFGGIIYSMYTIITNHHSTDNHYLFSMSIYFEH